jgi:ParB family transcriptional regulator, chromosome partitioning protein
MAEKRRGLGRGLGALIPSSPATTTPAAGQGRSSAGRVGRPVDLFFTTSGTSEPETESLFPADTQDAISLEEPTADQSAGTNKKAGTKAASKKKPEPAKAPGATTKAAKAAPAAETVDDAPAVGEDVGPGSAPEGASAGAGKAQEAAASKATAGEKGADQSAGAVNSESSTAPTGSEEAGAGSVEELEPIAPVSRETLVEVPGARFAEVPVEEIHPNRKQPRTVFDEDDMLELVHSVREIGILQPIVVRPSAEGGERTYELVMGERRWRAAQQAGLDSVPAIIRSTSDDDLLRDALLENLHRSQLNPLEEAAAYQQLLDDFGCTHDELAERIGRSRPQISNTLRLMKLPPLVQRRLAAGVLSAGHARALLALGDLAEMEKLAQRIVAEGLSVRATEEIVALADGLRRPAREAKPRVGARHERLDYLANSLSDRLDTNVKITLGARKGKVSIEFASVDDLNRIMTVINPGADG